MKIGSLFSGIGGIELGFEREGFETRWFVEKDLFCQSILRKHWPDRRIYADVQLVDFKELESVQILTGGFPCQDISIAGKGKGIIDGERSSLWKHFNRAIGEIRPKYAVIENVSAITFRGLCNVLSDLAENGYDAEWFDLRASDFGALHRRERIFIIAYPNAKYRNEIQGRKSNHEGSINSNTNSIGRNDRSDYWKERLFLQTEKREIKESESEWNRRKLRINENIETDFSDSDSKRQRRRSNEEPSQEKDDAEVQGRSLPIIITNDWSERIQRFKQETFQREQGFSWCEDVRRIEDFKGRRDIPEPLLRGKSNEFPFRVDRTKSIGNSVVPVVAQFIARRIKEIEKEN